MVSCDVSLSSAVVGDGVSVTSSVSFGAGVSVTLASSVGAGVSVTPAASVGDGVVVLNASSATAGALSSIISGCSLRHSSVFSRSTLFSYMLCTIK